MQPNLTHTNQTSDQTSARETSRGTTRSARMLHLPLRPLAQRAPVSRWDEVIEDLQNHY